MKIDVYCDEAYPDLLSSKKPQVRFMLLGSLWLQRDSRNEYKHAIHHLRDQHLIGGEFKWRKVSPSKIKFYKSLISWFYDQKESLRFRCIAIDYSQVNLMRFHDNDQELGFYKFYYQMLHHWIHDFNAKDPLLRLTQSPLDLENRILITLFLSLLSKKMIHFQQNAPRGLIG